MIRVLLSMAAAALAGAAALMAAYAAHPAHDALSYVEALPLTDQPVAGRS